MGYMLPRAVIVLIAWGTTCLIINTFTSVDPLVFYVAGGVWAFVGLIAFGYINKLRREEDAQFAHAIARARAAAQTQQSSSSRA
jgi:fatty acid desaturase